MDYHEEDKENCASGETDPVIFDAEILVRENRCTDFPEHGKQKEPGCLDVCCHIDQEYARVVVQALDEFLERVRIKASPSHEMIYGQRGTMRRRMNAIHLLWSETVSCDKVALSARV